MIRRTIVTFVLVTMSGLAPQGQATPPALVATSETKTLNLSAYAELLRSDVRAQKVAILTQLLELTDAEDKAFWPIYREYDLEMSTLGDQRVAMLEEYARSYSQLSAETATRLAGQALDLEAKRQAAKAKCYERLKTALSPRTALRALQVEHQLLLIIDLQISASLPIVK